MAAILPKLEYSVFDYGYLPRLGMSFEHEKIGTATKRLGLSPL